jgi:hypothetical protein
MNDGRGKREWGFGKTPSSDGWPGKYNNELMGFRNCFPRIIFGELEIRNGTLEPNTTRLYPFPFILAPTDESLHADQLDRWQKLHSCYLISASYRK